MNWMKTILEKHAEKDEFHIDQIVDELKAQFPMHAVPKHIYNRKAKELRKAKQKIEMLQNENRDYGQFYNRFIKVEEWLRKHMDG